MLWIRVIITALKKEQFSGWHATQPCPWWQPRQSGFASLASSQRKSCDIPMLRHRETVK